MSMEENNLYVAERCYAALGDVAKADYLRAKRAIEHLINYRPSSHHQE